MATTAPVSRSLSRIMFGESGASVADPDTRPIEQTQPQAQMLVLSHNPDLIDIVRKAAHSIAQVAQACDLDDAVESLPRVDPGVLVVDGSTTADLSTSIAILAERFPEVVIVVVGTRDESSELMQLIAAGRAYRFLLMPLSYGPVRLALAAAVSQHFERKAVNRQLDVIAAEVPTRRKFVISYVALALGLFVVIGGLWAASNLLVTRPAVTLAPATPPPPPEAANLDPALTQLARATEAMSQGRYVEPSGESALDLYRNALRLAPGNEQAKAGLRSLADEFLQRAEQALLAEQLEAAERAMAQVREIEASHPRLAFLDTQLARERERRDLSQQRDVSTKVRKLVDAARNDMQADNLIGNAAGGAVGALLKARRLDPEDPAVVQSVGELNSALADAVRLALTSGDTQRAQSLANAARRLGGGGQLLASVERSVTESARRSPAAVPLAAVAPITPPPTSGATLVDSISPPDAQAKANAAAGAGPDVVVQAMDLPRSRQVMPMYPQQAAEFGTEGYVDLEFTISTDGVPGNIKVKDAVPKRIFDGAAISCLRQWRWEPILQNGSAVTRNAKLRLRFALK